MQARASAPNQEERVRTVSNWILPVLATPTLIGRNFPRDANCLIYIDNLPFTVVSGSWAMDGNFVYMAQEAPGRIPLFDRLVLLAAMAAATGATQNELVLNAISTKLVAMIRESTTSVYSSLVVSQVTPKRLAVNLANCQVAAEINDRWALPGGAPAEVDASWITMDF
jgi:hypothetical protein